jgi:hypothetical protein
VPATSGLFHFEDRMDKHETTTQMATEAANTMAGPIAKAAPPVAVSAATVAGLSLSEWVLLATLIYTIAQMITLWRDKWGGRNQIKKVMAWLRKR